MQSDYLPDIYGNCRKSGSVPAFASAEQGVHSVQNLQKGLLPYYFLWKHSQACQSCLIFPMNSQCERSQDQSPRHHFFLFWQISHSANQPFS
ncbi:hypothetical protein FGO68_gene16342 [Halteria grandinella]|uniref:Uncharacterized protein n=1 Tax=Halteria grandinella TaxID=5974 RepID=A0A8J8NAV8_HALGN|nr:hypothetical protein FGO68_gene16342 [Halteria grandinella]